jgi:hypothetical protein
MANMPQRTTNKKIGGAMLTTSLDAQTAGR